MARCGCASAQCSCVLANGVNTTVNGDGSTGTPYQVNVSCEAIQDCIGAIVGQGLEYDDPGNKLRAKISGTGGNIIVFGADGGLYAPASAVALGCGLEFGGSGQIQVNLVAYGSYTRNVANDAIGGTLGNVAMGGDPTGGVGAYCEPTAGDIRVKPEKFVVTNNVSINETLGPATVPFTTTEIVLAITNPSAYYAMCGELKVAGLWTESSTANANPQTFFEFNLDDGAGYQSVAVRGRDTRGIGSVSQETMRPLMALNVCLDPSELKTFRFRMRWAFGTVHGGGTTQILAAAREIRFMGVNI